MSSNVSTGTHAYTNTRINTCIYYVSMHVMCILILISLFVHLGEYLYPFQTR